MAAANFSGRKAIVTGAGKGIGRETARLLAGQGAEVVAISRTESDLDSLAAEIGCSTIRAELADPGQARAAARQAAPPTFS